MLVAVSGGLDSMVLLTLLARLSREYHWKLAVAHFNHQLRGRSSDADERLVERTAKKLGLKFVSGRADVRKQAKEQGISLEMAARKLRHEFFGQAAARLKIRVIALAHHADDQVELFFLRLLRGSGGEGLAGMKWRNPSPQASSIQLVRPLLDQSKAALRSFAEEQGISFREDATNSVLDIQRNAIRHELLPLLTKKYQPALSRVILRQMDVLGAEADYIAQEARQWLRAPQGKPFATLPLAVQRRCLHLQLATAGIMANFELIEQLREAENRSICVNESLLVSRDRFGRIQVRPLEKSVFNKSAKNIKFEGRGGVLGVDSVEITWSIESMSKRAFRAPKRVVNYEQFDADKVGQQAILRHWQPGDRFQPIGMPSAIKLQDLFANQKVLRSQRHRVIVGATASGELFWVEGLRLAERFKLDKNTHRRLKWRWKRL
ncbi:MAG: tRNA(Ile)-lysidine synthase [Pedosphaera sp.]|nr:tRNA(Ile)-lysidine synthase [Pedosphaera sp.]